MRSYGQLCAVAKALDVVGDRWTLLVVRELLLRGPCRYTDIRDGLPGVATNLLAERLRDLEAAGLVEREDAPPPVATTLYRLTPRGEALKPALYELGRWGTALVPDAPDDDAFRGHWLAFPAETLLTDRAPDRPPVTVQVRSGDQSAVLETADGAVRVRPGVAEAPDASIDGPPKPVVGLLVGALDVDEARERGVRLEGDAAVLARLRP